jgi:hypothetical protein
MPEVSSNILKHFKDFCSENKFLTKSSIMGFWTQTADISGSCKQQIKIDH